jgi:hypothetical protein
MNYQHLLFPGRDDFTIVHVESNCYIGYADRRGTKYRVQNDYGDDIAIVSSIDKAIPALLAYYEKHPARWVRDSATEYTRLSQFGFLQVEQDRSGHWSAYRNDCPLLRDGKRRSFVLWKKPSRLPMPTCVMACRSPKCTPMACRGPLSKGCDRCNVPSDRVAVSPTHALAAV